MTKLTVKEALAEVLAEMQSLSPEDLRKDLDAHKNGGFAVAMREAQEFVAEFVSDKGRVK